MSLPPRAAADIVGETSRVTAGMPKEARGEYDLAKCMLWYIRFLQKSLQQKGTMDADGNVTIGRSERARLTKAQADLAEIELAKAQGAVIAIEEHASILSDLVQETKARFMSLPPRAAADIVGETSRVMVQAKLEKHVMAALSHLSKTVPRGTTIIPVSTPKEEKPKRSRPGRPTRAESLGI
jgi:hypothetical protein